MNYFAHGLRFLDCPWMLAGSAVPDWLSVADRGVRIREKHLLPFAGEAGGTRAAGDAGGVAARDDLAAGILAHLEDDRWFHQTAGFYETSGELTRLFRGALGSADGHRPGFLGHIAMELLVDALLIEAEPARLDHYYAAIGTLDPVAIEAAVNQIAPRQTTRLAVFVGIFQRERFLGDYLDPDRLRYRLNQVLGRIKLNPLPDSFAAVLVEAREIVRQQLQRLLPPERFASRRERAGSTVPRVCPAGTW